MRREFGFTGFGIGNPRPSSTATAAPDPYGPELVTNGGFDSGASWTLEGDALPTISTGKLRGTESEDGGAAIQDISATTAGTYHVVYTIDSISSGSVTVQVGDGNSAPGLTAGTFTEDIISLDSTGLLSVFLNGTNAVIDNISVKRVL